MEQMFNWSIVKYQALLYYYYVIFLIMCNL